VALVHHQPTTQEKITMRIVRYTYPVTRSLAPAFSVPTRSPWAGLETEIDRLFESAMTDFTGTPRDRHFPVDLYEDKDHTYVRAELPGVNRADIGVEMVDDYLTIQASRKQQTGDREESFSFSRSVSIPSGVQADKVTAAYENGVLTVTLPKQEAAKPKKIAVAVS
jgi:HSP20 family protein